MDKNIIENIILSDISYKSYFNYSLVCRKWKNTIETRHIFIKIVTKLLFKYGNKLLFKSSFSIKILKIIKKYFDDNEYYYLSIDKNEIIFYSYKIQKPTYQKHSIGQIKIYYSYEKKIINGLKKKKNKNINRKPGGLMQLVMYGAMDVYLTQNDHWN